MSPIFLNAARIFLVLLAGLLWGMAFLSVSDIEYMMALGYGLTATYFSLVAVSPLEET